MMIRSADLFRNLLLKIALIAMALFVFGAAGEILLRMAGPRLKQDPLRSADRSGVWFNPQETRRHPWAQQATNALRIAVIGDSFSLDTGVQMDDTYPARLERLLNMNDNVRPAMVRIYALCGTSTCQQLGLLREALEWRPHVVILGICLNDTEDWVAFEELQSWRRKSIPPQSGPGLKWLMGKSRLIALLVRKSEQAWTRREFYRYYERLYDKDYSGWNRFVWALELFRNDCANEGASFGVIVFPLLSENTEFGRYPLEFAHTSIRAALRQQGILGLDLLEAFRGKLPVRLQAIPSLDPHPNEIAHRIAAESLLVWLIKERLIDAAYYPRNTRGANTAIWQRIAETFSLAEGSNAPSKGRVP